MKEALYYKKLKNNIVRCQLCPRFCVIKENEIGNCHVRKNIKSKLFSLVYGKPCSAAVDPIEKKPFFHFLPGSKSYSIATVGCNLHCLQCQNYSISQAYVEDVPSLDLSPEEIVKDALANGCKSISYTYTEPASTVIEYVIDVAKLAKKKDLKNNIVSNGYINPEPLKELCKYIDAANIDLKGNEKFYKEICGDVRLNEILNSLKILYKNKIHIEITNLIIPGYNDSEKEIKRMLEWIKENLSLDIPIHFSRFFPYYKLNNIPPTPEKTLEKAKKIAENLGFKYVYIGNIFIDKAENTYCPKCKKLLIERCGFDILQNNITKNKCKFCDGLITGVWE